MSAAAIANGVDQAATIPASVIQSVIEQARATAREYNKTINLRAQATSTRNNLDGYAKALDQKLSDHCRFLVRHAPGTDWAKELGIAVNIVDTKTADADAVGRFTQAVQNAVGQPQLEPRINWLRKRASKATFVLMSRLQESDKESLKLLDELLSLHAQIDIETDRDRDAGPLVTQETAKW